VARIDDDGYVFIVDRKKEMIINSGGKNMSPSHIESALRVNLLLAASVVAVGDNRPFVTALIVLEPDAAAGFARANGIADTSPSALAEHPALRAALAAGIEKANATLSRVEQVREFTVLGTVWPPGGDELTPTMKLRRGSVSAKYAAEIDALYESS
jgi:long-subunit acyl-CoA synthetase (AMP-forming)